MHRASSAALVLALAGGAVVGFAVAAPNAGAHSDRVHHHVDTTTTTAPSTGSTTTTTSHASTTTTTVPACAQAFAPIDSALGALLTEVGSEPLSPRLRDSLTHLITATQRLEDAAAQAGCAHATRRTSLLRAAIRTMTAFEHRVRSLTGRQGHANAPRLLTLADGALQALRAVKTAP